MTHAIMALLSISASQLVPVKSLRCASSRAERANVLEQRPNHCDRHTEAQSIDAAPPGGMEETGEPRLPCVGMLAAARACRLQQSV